MNSSRTHILMVWLLILPAVVLADQPIPDLALSFCTCAYPGPETAVLFNLPNGGGSPFTEASIGNSVVDATITLTLLDVLGNPMLQYPREDLWLESVDGGMMVCPGGSTADDFTDVNGETTWVNPLRAGGFSQDLTRVFINGSPLESNAGLNVSYNSADINGDLIVNLADLALFAQDFYGGYAFRSDFFFDGVINLADVGAFTTGLGVSCP